MLGIILVVLVVLASFWLIGVLAGNHAPTHEEKERQAKYNSMSPEEREALNERIRKGIA